MLAILKRVAAVGLIVAGIAIISVISTLMTATYLKLDQQGLVPSALSLGGEHAVRGPRLTPDDIRPRDWSPKNKTEKYQI